MMRVERKPQILHNNFCNLSIFTVQYAAKTTIIKADKLSIHGNKSEETYYA